MEILNGNDGNEIENETDDTKRSMKLMLKSKNHFISLLFRK
jgi:hypothetical protein